MRRRVLIAAGSGSIGGLPLRLGLEALQPQRSGDASNDAIIQCLLHRLDLRRRQRRISRTIRSPYLAIERGRPPTLVRLVLEANPDAAGMLVEVKEENADNTTETSALHVLVSVQGRTALLVYGYFYASAISELPPTYLEEMCDYARR